MAYKRWILWLILILGLGHSVAQPTVKLATMTRVRAITDDLFEITKERAPHHQRERSSLVKEVNRPLENERNPDVLARVALISNIYMSPGQAGDEAFDGIFDVAWEACVRRIAEIGGQPAIDALQYIRSNMRLDGGYSLIWEESMERVSPKQPSGNMKEQRQ